MNILFVTASLQVFHISPTILLLLKVSAYLDYKEILNEQKIITIWDTMFFWACW